MTIKRFKSFIKEAYLDDYQRGGFTDYAASRGFKIDLDTPSVQAKKISGKAMPDSIELPMMNSTMQAVHDHLKSNGYSEVDYANKVVHKDTINNRGEKQRQTTIIGKALTKTKADQSLIDSFNNDNHKEAGDLAKNYKVIISRIPRHIAACSTNTPWNSCAALDSAGYPSVNTPGGWGDPKEFEDPHKFQLDHYAAGHLPMEIKHGTHVAYMVPNREDSHDNLIEDAKARILLKPFTSDTGHAVISPEKKGYIDGHRGNVQVPQGFKDTVANFANTHFPMTTNTVYKKHPSIYNDDGVYHKINLDLMKPVDAYSSDVQSSLDNVSAPHITHYLNSVINDKDNTPNQHLLSDLISSKNINDSHMKLILHPNIIGGVSDNKLRFVADKITKPENFDAYFSHVLNNNKYGALHFSFAHKLFTDNHKKQLLNLPNKSGFGEDPIRNIKDVIVRHRTTKGPLLDDIVSQSHSNPDFKGVIYNGNLNEDHISHIINHYDNYVDGHKFIQAQNTKFSEDHIHKLIDAHTKGDVYHNFHNLAPILFSDTLNRSHIEKLQTKLPQFIDHYKTGIINQKNEDINNYLLDSAINTKNHDLLDEVVRGQRLSSGKLSSAVDYMSKAPNYAPDMRDLASQSQFTSEHFGKLTTAEKYNSLDDEKKGKLIKNFKYNTHFVNTFLSNIANSPTKYQPFMHHLAEYHSGQVEDFNVLKKLAAPKAFNKLHDTDKAELIKAIHSHSDRLADYPDDPQHNTIQRMLSKIYVPGLNPHQTKFKFPR